MSARLVYSTGSGEMCPECEAPIANCRCAKQGAADDEIPEHITAKLRMERQGRGGKMVTVIFGLPNNAVFLKELAAKLKAACGTGGTVRAGIIELAGDVRERVRPLLEARGIRVKA